MVNERSVGNPKDKCNESFEETTIKACKVKKKMFKQIDDVCLRTS